MVKVRRIVFTPAPARDHLRQFIGQRSFDEIAKLCFGLPHWVSYHHAALLYVDLIGAMIHLPSPIRDSLWIRGVALRGRLPCLHATARARFRPLKYPCVLEKMVTARAVLALVMQDECTGRDCLCGTDRLLGLLFVIAYFKTPVSAVVGDDFRLACVVQLLASTFTSTLSPLRPFCRFPRLC